MDEWSHGTQYRGTVLHGSREKNGLIGDDMKEYHDIHCRQLMISSKVISILVAGSSEKCRKPNNLVAIERNDVVNSVTGLPNDQMRPILCSCNIKM